MKKRKKINYRISKKYRNMKTVIEKRYISLIFLIVVSFTIILINLFYLQVMRNDYYRERVEKLNVKTVSGPSAPRGRIYDRHHRLIVDNRPVKVITYKRESTVDTKQELQIAELLSDILDVNYTNITLYNLKKYWIINNPEAASKKITDIERQMFKERKISTEELEKFKFERITQEELEKYSEKEKKIAYIYFLMNNGYYFDDKIIKDNSVTDIEYAKISENINLLKGVTAKLDWERYYPYGNVFRTILGSVSTTKSGIPLSQINYYLAKGYKRDDRVGISYLEYQYEDILQGEKNIYEVKDGEKLLISQGKRGNDIVLTIDIELQKQVEQIISDRLIAAKTEKNTEFLNSSFVIISDPNTGEILAMAGKELNKNGDLYDVYDFTPGVATSSVVAGSVVKGASNIVAFNNGALNIGERRDDYCVKIASTPEKCSWRYLGILDDINALKYSSNSFQYQSAIKLGQATYVRDKPLNISHDAFLKYREGFAEFGLGIKTEIDLPVESVGYKGNSKKTGHLLDFAIGQYDTYTPIQLAQYINTIANSGNRLKPQILKTVYSPSEEGLKYVLYNINSKILNKVKTEDKYINRVQEGFKAVMEPGGTGMGHIVGAIGAGKTGTSEGFIDTNNDGMVDTMVYSNNFIGYAPYNNPIVTFTVVSPNTYHNENNINYRTNINYLISREVSKKFFEIYQ